MNTIKKSLAVAGLPLLAAPPLHALLSGAGTTDALVLSYAVLLPFIFMLSAIAGTIAAAFGDLLSRFPVVASFGWRPGRAHLTGRDRKKKRP